MATVMTTILPKIPEDDGPKMYEWDKHNVCVLGDGSLLYVAIIDKGFPLHVVFAYLDAILLRFKATYGSVDHFRAHQCNEFDDELVRQGVRTAAPSPCHPILLSSAPTYCLPCFFSVSIVARIHLSL